MDRGSAVALTLPRDETGDSGAGWQILFADLLGILLSLFILVQSTRSPATDDDRLSVTQGPAQQTSVRPPELRLELGTDTDYLGTVLMGALASMEGAERLDVRFDEDRVILRAPSTVWRGEDGLMALPKGMAGVLERLRNDILLRVHPRKPLRGRDGASIASIAARTEALRQGQSLLRALRSFGFSRRASIVLGPVDGGVAGDWIVELDIGRHAAGA